MGRAKLAVMMAFYLNLNVVIPCPQTGTRMTAAVWSRHGLARLASQVNHDKQKAVTRIIVNSCYGFLGIPTTNPVKPDHLMIQNPNPRRSGPCNVASLPTNGGLATTNVRGLRPLIDAGQSALRRSPTALDSRAFAWHGRFSESQLRPIV